MIALVAAIIMFLRAVHVLNDSADVEWALVAASFFFLHFAIEYPLGSWRRD